MADTSTTESGDDDTTQVSTEVLANRLPHANGVTWVFHDPVIGFVRQVNVPNIPPVAQQQPSQRSAQSSHSNEMVLY